MVLGTVTVPQGLPFNVGEELASPGCHHCWVCYNRQVARYQQRKGGKGQVAGNCTSCKQRGSMGKQRKAGTPRLTGNHTFWGNKRPGDRQRKVRKGGNLLPLNVTCCSLCSHYNKISIADKKYPSRTDAMTLLI